MSGGGFHVHGPTITSWSTLRSTAHMVTPCRRYRVVTAIIATVGAMFAYMGGATQANAGLYKNNAAIKKTEASNQWNYYQAKSSKQNLSELAIELAPESKKAFYTEEINRYKKEKADIKKDAEKLEAESKEWDKKSDDEMHQHHAGRRPPRRCKLPLPSRRSLCLPSAAGWSTAFTALPAWVA